jgi:hypothetical protein
MEPIKRRLSPALLLSVIAVVIAVVGSSVAVSTAKKKKKVNPISYVTKPVTAPPQATNDGVFEDQIDCPAKTKVVGGGLTLSQTEPLDPIISESGPLGNGWHVAGDNDTTTAQPGTLTAVCFKK